MILDPRVTFTRASIGTRVNELGLIDVIQNDIPRVDYDPIELVPKGLLIEEARTSIISRSNTFTDALWGKVKVTITDSTDFPIFANEGVFY